MAIVISIVVFVIALWIFAYSSGKRKFWTLVSKHPNEAFSFFVENSDNWYVTTSVGLSPDLNPDEWVGPFFVNFNDVGTLRVYGKKGQFEADQDEFIKMYEKPQAKQVS